MSGLLYDGECPVCGDEFVDGFESVDAGEQIDGVRICVVEKDGTDEIGEAIMHLPDGYENE